MTVGFLKKSLKKKAKKKNDIVVLGFFSRRSQYRVNNSITLTTLIAIHQRRNLFRYCFLSVLFRGHRQAVHIVFSQGNRMTSVCLPWSPKPKKKKKRVGLP